MKIGFNKILIPVDFTLNTRAAIRKALSLSEGSTQLHLLHIAHRRDIRNSQEKLARLRTEILNFRRDIEIIACTLVHRSIESAIIENAKKFGADLIVVGKNSHHSWLAFRNTVVPATIAKKSGIAVLTVKQGVVNGVIRTVVVPVGEGFPYTKVAAINALKTKFRFQTRLVTFRASLKDPVIVPGSLLNAYRILKNNPDTQVSYDILYGNNRAKAILAYCARVNADLLILNPETEMEAGWMKRQIQDVMPTHSKTQILAVLQT